MPTSRAGATRKSSCAVRVVSALAAVFRESWALQGCKGELPPAPAPRVATPGQRVVKLVVGDPANGINPSYTALLHAIDAAQRSVQLTMAYFAPGDELIQALCDAARRGVAVSLVLPGRSDVTLVLHAARSRYAQLLEAGVQVHEMTQSVMHAKTAVVDGVYSSVGSSNLDWRSIVGNHEMDVIVLGDDFGQQMQALFSRDLTVSRRIDPRQWGHAQPGPAPDAGSGTPGGAVAVTAQARRLPHDSGFISTSGVSP